MVSIYVYYIIHNDAVQIWKQIFLLNINKFPSLYEADIYWK